MYEIEQTQQKYYEELEHNWDEATQVINGDTGFVLKRTFSFLEWETDYRAVLINEPPDPAPYYGNQTPATAYFSVVRTVFNTVYEGGEELEVAGEGVNSAAKFKQWKQIKTQFDYERIWLDLEYQSLLWKPNPPPPVTEGSTSTAERDPRYELYLGDNLIREHDEDVLVLNIPRGVWGISCNVSEGVYLTDSVKDESRATPVTTQTQLINKPCLRFVKSKNSQKTFRVSLRGKTSQYLPGTFIPRDYSDAKILDFPNKLPRSQRLVPPGVTFVDRFGEKARKNTQAIAKRDGLNWTVN